MNQQNLSIKELKAHKKAISDKATRRYWQKKYDNAPMISCACGCGESIKSVDFYGRQIRYVQGHHLIKYDNPQEHKRVYDRKVYKDPELKANKMARKKKSYHDRKSKLIILMGGACSKCNLTYDGKNGMKFQFHHRDPDTKIDRITFDWKWEQILKESEKCDLVCANCHFEIHCDPY